MHTRQGERKLPTKAPNNNCFSSDNSGIARYHLAKENFTQKALSFLMV
jgi:hypothetical protein